MKISQFNSRSERERERERESSLRTSSSLKKSFTLIELSIVLLILSLLVGSLLVGRQIVDRAKIQRIIFEFDYYEKAFHQFYDTYRVVPGNMGHDMCAKYSQFTQVKEKRSNLALCPTHFCGKTSHDKTMFGDLWRCTVQAAMGHLYYAGLSETYAYPAQIKNFNMEPAYLWSSSGRTLFIAGNTEGSFGQNVGYFAISSYDPNVYIQPMGWHTERWTEHGGYKNFSGYIFCGSNTYKNGSLPHEFQNSKYMSALNHHNTLSLLRNPIVKKDVLMPNESALPAKMASELDAKLDDGRPGTGRILAMKGGNAHRPDTTKDEHLANCYDQMADQVDKAIYHSGTNLKHGCNITYVIEDMK